MHPMMKLLASNRRKGEFRAETKGDEATLYLYDLIVGSDAEAEWWGGVSPEAFTKALRALSTPTIHLRVNSPGGNVFAARAIEQALREHDSKIIAHIDGYAASAASFLVMGADEIEISPGGFVMIHKSSTFAFGNADDLMSVAALLEQVDESLIQSYAERTGQSVEDLAKWIAAETWLDAAKAVELGFADRVAEGSKTKATSASARWDMSAYSHAPKPAAIEPMPEPSSEPDREALHRAVLRKLIPA